MTTPDLGVNVRMSTSGGASSETWGVPKVRPPEATVSINCRFLDGSERMLEGSCCLFGVVASWLDSLSGTSPFALTIAFKYKKYNAKARIILDCVMIIAFFLRSDYKFPVALNLLRVMFECVVLKEL